MTKKLYLIVPAALSFFIINTFGQTAALESTLKLNNVNGVTVPYQNGIPLPAFQKQTRQIIDLKGTWKKERFASDETVTFAERNESGMQALAAEANGRFDAAYDDNGWIDKTLPAVENEMRPYPTVPEFYTDGVWYRRKFNIADSLEGKYVKLMFYAVNYVADVWVNGTYIGYHEGGYTPFAFDVSEVLNYGSENVVAIRVDNPRWGTRKDIVPYVMVDWFNYTGIIHDVYLEVSDPVNIVRTDVVPKGLDGTLQASVTVFNKLTGTNNTDSREINVSIEVFEANVTESNINTGVAADLAGSSVLLTGITQTTLTIPSDTIDVWRTNLQISNPKLWSPLEPDLYIMKVTLTESGNVLDEFYTQFGIRTLETNKSKVLLNGNVVFLTGVARHEDHPVYGRSIPVDVIYEDLKMVKGVNANFLRTAHYPNHLQTYQLADRMGITIMEEIPVWQFDEQDPWLIQNEQRHIHEQMFREMVFKDFNSPSIIMWSTQNESKNEVERKIYIDRIKEEYTTNYPDGRLLSQSAAADRPGVTDTSQLSCDVAGWTMYFGIFYGTSGYYFQGTNFFLSEVQTKMPDKPVLTTEYGYWSSESGTSTTEQTKVFNDTWLALRRKAPIKTDGTYDSTGFVMGVTWWCIFDWYRSATANGYQTMGLYSMERTTKKPVTDALKSAYAPYYNVGGMIITGVNDHNNSALPDKFTLEQNYPNPFNPVTKIRFTVPAGLAGQVPVQLKIYDILGNEITTLIDKNMPAGEHEAELNSADYNLSSGVYFYRLTTSGNHLTRKMVLLK
jgi:beta-glucuronidase